MKKKIANLLASALAFLCATMTANALHSYNFEVATPDWVGDAGVIRDGGGPNHDGTSLKIPVNNTVSNDVNGGLTGTAWTDFYTIPVRYSSAALPEGPAVDPDATVQFFVNSNGLWVTMSGAGGVKTVCTESLVAGLAYPAVTQYTELYHVSVFQNYNTRKWSLFVNNVPLAENLDFIDQTPPSEHDWFKVQNLGGNATNVCWLDDYLVTNSIATSGSGNTLTNVVPGTGVPVAAILAHFGTVSDPRKTNQTVGVAGDGVNLTFGGGSGNGNYVIYGTPNYNLGGLASNGVVTANSFMDNDVLSGSTNRYFYKLLTVSGDGALILTNAETYAAYKQSRSQVNYYWTGVPVDYGESNKLNSALGQQLARGLLGNDFPAQADTLTMYTASGQVQVFLATDGKWHYPENVSVLATNAISRGQAVLIEKRSAGSDGGFTSAIFAGLALGNNTNTIAIHPGWNFLCWPEDASNRVWQFSGNGSDNVAAADRIWLPSRAGRPAKQFRLWSTLGWQFEPRTGIAPSNDAVWAYMQPGEGFFYTNSAGSERNWQP